MPQQALVGSCLIGAHRHQADEDRYDTRSTLSTGTAHLWFYFPQPCDGQMDMLAYPRVVRIVMQREAWILLIATYRRV